MHCCSKSAGLRRTPEFIRNTDVVPDYLIVILAALIAAYLRQQKTSRRGEQESSSQDESKCSGCHVESCCHKATDE